MNEHEPDIIDLVERAKRGDHEAFAGLHDIYAARMFRFVRFRIGHLADAEDVVQRVYLTVIETLPRYEQRGVPFGAWLFRIARNAVIDHLRRQRSHETIDAAAFQPVDGMSPEEGAIRSSELSAVGAALASLTAEQREVIALRFFAGLSAAEAGAVMGKREGSIRALQFRALANLRRSMGLPEAGGESESEGAQ